MKHFFFSVSLLLAFGSLSAQATDSSRYLALPEARQAASSSNDAVKLAAIDEQLAKSRFRQTDAFFLPQVNFSYSALSTNNPLHAFGFKLQQKSIGMADFDPSLLNHPDAATDFTTKIELLQPLVNIDMLYQRKGAAKQIESYRLITQRTKEALGNEAEKVYLQLQLLYAAEAVLTEAKATATAFEKNATAYFSQGLIQYSDLLNAGLQVTNLETQIHANQLNRADASDMLSLLMNQPTGTSYRVDSLQWNEPILETFALPENRADFKAMQQALEAYQWMIRASKMSFLPRLNGFAFWQLNDKAMFGFGSQAYLAGVQLSWNLFNGNRIKNSIAQQTLEKSKLAAILDQKKKEANLQIVHAQHQLSDALFARQQAAKAVEQASEVLRVLQNRYQQGLVKTTDVLQAQTQLAQQKLGNIQAIYQYQTAVAELRFLTAGK